MKAKKLLKYAGRLLLIISIAYMAKKIFTYRTELTTALTAEIGLYVAVCSVATSLLVLMAGALYHGLVRRVTGKPLNLPRIMMVYCKTNLYKYLPGNVGHYVGRQIIAADNKQMHGQVAACSVLEACISAAASLIVSLVFSFAFVSDWLVTLDVRQLLVVGVVLLVAAGVLLMLLRKKLRRLYDSVKHYFTARNARWLLFMLVYNVLNQAINGLLFVLLLKMMCGSIPSSYIPQIVGVYSFAWLVGFITPGVPGGIGIRESMLTVLLNSMIDSEVIIAAVLINRIVTILGDALAYPLAWVAGSVRGQIQEESTWKKN